MKKLFFLLVAFLTLLAIAPWPVKARTFGGRKQPGDKFLLTKPKDVSIGFCTDNSVVPKKMNRFNLVVTNKGQVPVKYVQAKLSLGDMIEVHSLPDECQVTGNSNLWKQATVTCRIRQIAVGQSRRIPFYIRYNLPGQYKLTAEVFAGRGDINSRNNRFSRAIKVNNNASMTADYDKEHEEILVLYNLGTTYLDEVNLGSIRLSQPDLGIMEAKLINKRGQIEFPVVNLPKGRYTVDLLGFYHTVKANHGSRVIYGVLLTKTVVVN